MEALATFDERKNYVVELRLRRVSVAGDGVGIESVARDGDTRLAAGKGRCSAKCAALPRDACDDT
jgi:hypothetical protein